MSSNSERINNVEARHQCEDHIPEGQTECEDDDGGYEMTVDCEDDDMPDYSYQSLEASSRPSTSSNASPVPRLLPLRRPPSTAAARTSSTDGSLHVAGTQIGGISQPSTTAATNAVEGRETEDAPPVDKIGSYFGYNGTDGNVPKPAYDAMLQRVRTLEDALGNANRELRTQAKTIGDQEGRLQSMRQQLERSEALVQRIPALEAALAARQRDLDFREQALEHVARQQRRLHSKKRHQQHLQDEDPDNDYSVPLHDVHGLNSSHSGEHNYGPSYTSDDGPSHQPFGAGSRRRPSLEASGGNRREEEAYMMWMHPNIVSPTPQGVGVRRTSSHAATSLASLLEAERNARRAQLLPRIPIAGGTQRSQSSLGM